MDRTTIEVAVGSSTKCQDTQEESCPTVCQVIGRLTSALVLNTAIAMKYLQSHMAMGPDPLEYIILGSYYR